MTSSGFKANETEIGDGVGENGSDGTLKLWDAGMQAAVSTAPWCLIVLNWARDSEISDGHFRVACSGWKRGVGRFGEKIKDGRVDAVIRLSRRFYFRREVQAGGKTIPSPRNRRVPGNQPVRPAWGGSRWTLESSA